MELALLCLSAGLFILGTARYLMFRTRMKKYERTKAVVSNIEIETRYFSTDGTEITRHDYDLRHMNYPMWKEVSYYSPEITYHANDGMAYTGTWWTEMPGRLPYNIGERIEIYFNPDQPAKFFLYDKMMMFWEPMLLVFIGTAGILFFSFYMQ